MPAYRLIRLMVMSGLLLLISVPVLWAAPAAGFSIIPGRPTDCSITLSLLADTDFEGYLAWGTRPGRLEQRTATVAVHAGQPTAFELSTLRPATRHYYRLFRKMPAESDFQAVGSEQSFHTARSPGSSFSFALQGDSHPERNGKMFNAGLYSLTMQNAAAGQPDFYLLMGDDFSIERLIERQLLTQQAVDQVYVRQRAFLAMIGAPLFLVNGNHEQAARYLLDGSDTNAAVLAARARNRFYPQPAPDHFYSGDDRPVEPIGLLRDYYAFTWGDALFVVIDPYWHSPVSVDNRAGERPQNGKVPEAGRGKRDLWQITLGDEQYRWLTQTLATSRARWKFVFAHHVNGTGRGGREAAGLYEWGGRDRRGDDRFQEKRPGWPLPIHQLLVKHRVTIFFQGHDHLFARQELDGVIYQSVPSPADNSYQAFNREAYRTGDILPNAGHLRVTVQPEQVMVDYIRSFLKQDETSDRKNGMTGFSYTLKTRQ